MNDNSIKINDNTLSVESWIEHQTIGNDENGEKNLSERNRGTKHSDSESRAQKKASRNKEDLKRQDENDSEMAIEKEINKINECANCTNLDTTKDYTIIVPPRKKMRNMTDEEVQGGSQNSGKANGEETSLPPVNGQSSEQDNITESLQSSSFDLKRKKKKLKKKSSCDGSHGENGQGGKSGKNKPKGKNAQREKKYDQTVDQSSDEGGDGDSSEENGEGSDDQSSGGEDDVSNSLTKKKGKKTDKQKTRNMLREKLNKTKKINFKKEKNNTKMEKQRYAKYKRSKENIKMTFDVTSRFTVLGCDWDNISSADIFYLFESYYNFEKRKKKNIDYSKSRAVKKVTIYTSKYGEKKLKQEKKHGPKINLDILKLKRKGDGAVYRQNNFLDYFQDEEGDEVDEGDLSSSEDSNNSGGAEQSVNNDESVESDGSEDLDDSADQDDSTGDDESADSDSSTSDGAKGKKAKLKKKKNEQANLHSNLSADEEEENEKIRLYQIQRSRYYFAVVECYNKEIVEFLYEELNDMDADFCINYLDLRIIDDNCSLDDYKVKETCNKIPDNYQFHYSVSTPLKHTHAKSTWDENPKRKKLLSTRFSEEKLRELDLKEYLANSSSSDGEEEEQQNRNEDNSPLNKREKDNREYYRKLLLGDWLNEDDTQSGQKEEPNWGVANNSGKGTLRDDVNKKNLSIYMDEMEEDFASKEGVINLSKEGIFASNKNSGGSITNELTESYHEKGGEKNKRKAQASNTTNADDSDNENEVVQVFKNMLKSKDQKEEKKNPWDKYLDRVRQKKKLKKKAYLESLKKKDEEIKKIITKKTNKRKKDVMFKGHGENLLEKVNDGHLIDSRFADLYKNKDFNLDITNPHFKKTKFNEEILQKKKL